MGEQRRDQRAHNLRLVALRRQFRKVGPGGLEWSDRVAELLAIRGQLAAHLVLVPLVSPLQVELDLSDGSAVVPALCPPVRGGLIVELAAGLASDFLPDSVDCGHVTALRAPRRELSPRGQHLGVILELIEAP